MNLLERIDDWARAHPAQVVHRSAERTLTWLELSTQSDAVAGAIARARLPAASPVVVRGHKEPEMLVAFVGCAKAGHPYVPIDAGTPDLRAAGIIAACGAELVLSPEDVRRLVAQGAPGPAVVTSADTPLYIMFTSGSTGEPKGVIITRGCLDAFLGWMLREQEFVEGAEVFLNQALYSFDLSVMDTWCTLATGGIVGSLSSADVSDYARLFQVLSGAGITTWVSTPPFAQLCLAEPRFGERMLPALRRFLFCGDVLAPEVARQLLARFPNAEVWNTYGPTEATVATTSVRVDAALLDRVQVVPIGVAMPGTAVLVEDDEGRTMPDGARGEIVIVGPNVSPGYYGRPDLTARAFSLRGGQRAYRTGDWGSRDEGMLFFHGRMDAQVKIAGHRIEPGDVEAQVARLPGVRAACVIATARAGRPLALHAFLVLAYDGRAPDLPTRATLLEQLSRRLPAYMLPSRFHFLESLPLTTNGKVDRKALVAMLAP